MGCARSLTSWSRRRRRRVERQRWRIAHWGASMIAMAHSTQAAHGNMQDHEAHVLAVEADLEYWRAKRLEPRVLQLHRRGVVTLYDLLRAAAQVPTAPIGVSEAAHDIEGRIRALEDGLDDYI